MRASYLSKKQNHILYFLGHSGPITALVVPKQSNFLITGSEDTSVIVWDITTLTIKFRLRYVYLRSTIKI